MSVGLLQQCSRVIGCLSRSNEPNPTARSIALERRCVRWQRRVEVRLLPLSRPELCRRMPVCTGTPHLVLVDDELHGRGQRRLDSMIGLYVHPPAPLVPSRGSCPYSLPPLSQIRT
jgi:hypothetical protein